MLLKISLIFINVFEGISVKKIKGRKICFPALQLAPILNTPLQLTAVQTSDGKIECPAIGAVAARHLSPLLIASLQACLQTVGILTGCPTNVKQEETSCAFGAGDEKTVHIRCKIF